MQSKYIGIGCPDNPARVADYGYFPDEQEPQSELDIDANYDEQRAMFDDAGIDPHKYYIDRRLGIDVSLPKSFYKGTAWIERSCDVEFLREVVINESSVFIEVEQ